MLGPALVARGLSHRTVTDRNGRSWQYHPRSARHLRLATWAMAIDLVRTSTQLRDDLAAESVGLAFRHRLIDPRNGRRLRVDLVIGGLSNSTAAHREGSTRLVDTDLVALDPAARTAIGDLPPTRHDVHDVHIAVIVAASMAVAPAPRRLLDGLLTAQESVARCAPSATIAAYVVVNAAPSVVSPLAPPGSTGTRGRCGAERTIALLNELPRRQSDGKVGFDGVGVSVVDLANDGSAVRPILGAPAPTHDQRCHYDTVVRTIAKEYERRGPASSRPATF